MRPHQPVAAKTGWMATALIVGIFAMYLAITIPLAAVLNVGQDEAYALHTTSAGVQYALEQSLHFEFQPPLYFVALAMWRQIDHSIFFARCFSIMLVALALWASLAVSRRLLPGQNPAWLLAALALNPAVIWAALEIRAYPLVLLLSMLLLLTFVRGFVERPNSVLFAISHVVLLTASLYTQYFLGFSAVGFACALALLQRWRSLAEYVAGCCLAALAFVPMLRFVGAQAAAQQTGFRGTSSFLSDALLLGKILGLALLPVRWVSLHGLPFVAAIVGVFIFLLGRRLLQQRPLQASSPQLAVWFALGIAALTFALAESLTRTPIANRYATFLLAPTMVSVFAIFALLGQRARLASLAAWTALALLASVITLYVTYRPLAKTGDWIRVAEYIERAESPNQPILIFTAEAAVPFSQYYAGRNQIVPLPQPLGFDTYDLRRIVLRNPAQVALALDRAPGSHEVVWMVRTDYCDNGSLDFNCRALDDFIAREYEGGKTVIFYGSSVQLLRRKAAALGSVRAR
jgi:uncharacterized membrane protein